MKKLFGFQSIAKPFFKNSSNFEKSINFWSFLFVLTLSFLHGTFSYCPFPFPHLFPFFLIFSSFPFFSFTTIGEVVGAIFLPAVTLILSSPLTPTFHSPFYISNILFFPHFLYSFSLFSSLPSFTSLLQHHFSPHRPLFLWPLALL